MNPMNPLVLIKQVEDLENVMREQTKPIDRIVRNILTPLEYRSLHRLYIIGDGDSFHAAMSTEMAFENLAKIPCEPMSAMRFLEYGADYIRTSFPNDTLVVGVSASGRTKRVAQALEKANQSSRNIITAAICGKVDGMVGQNADRKIPVQIPDMGRSPGVRTYSASLLGLLLLAIRIGEIDDRYHQIEANSLRHQLTELADVVAATCEASKKPAKEAAKALKDAKFMMFIGSGPSYGTAYFSSAKLIESAGVMSMGQDLEEWAHVERFVYPDNTPIFIIAPPGKGYWRALDLAKSAKELGRQIIAIIDSDDTEISRIADFVFPVMGGVREEFSPLVYQIGATLFASYLTEELGRNPFQTDRPEVLERMAAMFAAHRTSSEAGDHRSA